MKKKRAGFAALLCTLLIVLDQITKALTVSVLKLHDIVVIPGVLTLTYVENRGAAFGIFQDKKIFFFFNRQYRCNLLSGIFFYTVYFDGVNFKENRQAQNRNDYRRQQNQTDYSKSNPELFFQSSFFLTLGNGLLL